MVRGVGGVLGRQPDACAKGSRDGGRPVKVGPVAADSFQCTPTDTEIRYRGGGIGAAVHR
jgi:hypothetical protein